MLDAASQLSLFDEQTEPDEMSGFSVRESSRAKRLSIRVFPRGKVEVVVPRRTRVKDVEAFVNEHKDWIQSTRAAFAEKHPPEPFALPSAVRLPGVDQNVPVRYEHDPQILKVRYRLNHGTVVLKGQTGNDKHCVAALKRWLATVAKSEFLPQLRALSALTGNGFSRMHVRGQRTCWGSHSSSGTISINYCLLFLDPRLVRYLMVHELCHGRHMNHSRRYWRHVAEFEPDYKRLDRELADAWQHIPSWLGIY